MVGRLTYAAIGAVLGAIVGVLLWWLFGLDFQPNPLRAGIEPDPAVWLKYSTGMGGVVGFFVQDRVGDFLGSIVQEAFKVELGNDRAGTDVPTWLVVAVVALAIAAAWWFAS